MYRAKELTNKPITGDFDLEHFKKIHEKLFSDIYSRAGKLRVINISKGNSRFAHHAYIAKEVNKLTSSLCNENFLKSLDPHEFSKRAGFYMGEINAIHPFREGNGRTIREYIGNIAKNANYPIQWKDISKSDIIQASIMSFSGHSEQLSKLIENNLYAYKPDTGLSLLFYNTIEEAIDLKNKLSEPSTIYKIPQHLAKSDGEEVIFDSTATEAEETNIPAAKGISEDNQQNQIDSGDDELEY